MYPEFIAIYVGLGVLTVLLIVVIVLQIIILKRGSGSWKGNIQSHQYAHTNQSMGVVFCKNCATQFNAALRVCPNCKTPR